MGGNLLSFLESFFLAGRLRADFSPPVSARLDFFLPEEDEVKVLAAKGFPGTAGVFGALGVLFLLFSILLDGVGRSSLHHVNWGGG